MGTYNQEYYQKNREKMLARSRITSKASKQRFKERIKEIKMSSGCTRCGYNRCARALHFHHTDPTIKDFSLNRAFSGGKSYQSILDEVEKCVVLCANCHSELHDEGA